MSWAPLYVDADELEEFVRVAADNPYVGTYGTAAARAIDGFCNRQFGKFEAATALTYEWTRAARTLDNRWLLPVDDLMDLTGFTVTVDGAAVTAGATGYQLWPRNAAAKGEPYTALSFYERPYGDVVGTGKWGWSAYPAAVTAAMWVQVNAWNIRRESPYGTGGSTGDGEVSVTGSRRLDPDARAMLSTLVRPRLPR